MKNKIQLLKAIADETRLNILELLLNGERCVCEIFPNVKKTQSTVSIHLNNLEKLKIVSSRREGKFTYYKLSNQKVADLINLLERK